VKTPHLLTPNLTLFLTISSGVLLTAAFPKIGFPWAAWIALVPLLLAISGQATWKSFRIGLLAGFVHFLMLVYWLSDTMQTYGQLPLYVSLPVLILFSLYLSLYIAGFCAVISRFSNSLFLQILLIPIVWTAFEYARAHFLSGFPWEMLGYSQFLFLRIIQISDLTGVYGVSFFVAFGNAWLFLIWLVVFPKNRLNHHGNTRRLAWFTGLFIATWVTVLAYGEKRLSTIDQLIANAQAPQVAVVQGNISQSLKWDPAFLQTTTEKYIALSKSVLTENPSLIVWPETATPFYFLSENRYTPSLIGNIQGIGKDFVIGSPAIENNGNQISYRNRAYMVTSTGTMTGFYDKTQLVPFGEFVPLKTWLPFLGKIVAQVGDFEPGPEGKTLLWKNYQLGIQICYEMIFPSLSRKMVRNGADCIVNITNDAWYGTSSAPYQLFSMAVFRAIENRRSVVRAANTGISGFIDPAGRIIGFTELFTDSTLTRKVPMLQEISDYTEHGDLLAIICLLITGIILFRESIVALTNRKRHSK
jgi:apolipoprotein N-acyltransferase